MAPDLPLKIVGIRPGEKLHEIMCPADDSHLTLEFVDHYVIRPPSSSLDVVDFSLDRLGERGQRSSWGSNSTPALIRHFLTVEEIAALNQ